MYLHMACLKWLYVLELDNKNFISNLSLKLVFPQKFQVRSFAFRALSEQSVKKLPTPLSLFRNCLRGAFENKEKKRLIGLK